MLFPIILASLISPANASTESQVYNLHLQQAAQNVTITVPFAKVIEMQSYILRACIADHSLASQMKVTLDGKEGSNYPMGSGCVMTDWGVALTTGTHRITVTLNNEIAQTNFEVVHAPREKFGIVGSGRYLDWSILRAGAHAGEYVMCSLSLEKPLEATLAGPDEREIARPAIAARTDAADCYDITGLVIPATQGLPIHTLNIKLDGGHSVAFPMQAGQL